MRWWAAVLSGLGGICGAAGVGLGAWAAHHASSDTIAIASQYLLFHAGVITAVALLADRRRCLLLAVSIMATGVLLFAGDLSVRGLTGIVIWTLAAPTGGILLIAGWLALAVSGALMNLRKTA